MNYALAINEGAEDALLQAIVKPLFIKKRQTQRPRTVGVHHRGGRNEDARFRRKTVFVFCFSSFLCGIFFIIRCVAKTDVCSQLDYP